MAKCFPGPYVYKKSNPKIGNAPRAYSAGSPNGNGNLRRLLDFGAVVRLVYPASGRVTAHYFSRATQELNIISIMSPCLVSDSEQRCKV